MRYFINSITAFIFQNTGFYMVRLRTGDKQSHFWISSMLESETKACLSLGYSVGSCMEVQMEGIPMSSITKYNLITTFAIMIV